MARVNTEFLNVTGITIRQTPDPNSPTDLDQATFVTQTAPNAFPELFILWDNQLGQCIPTSISIARSLNVSLLREALVHNLRVIITHEETSAFVDAVKLFPPGG